MSPLDRVMHEVVQSDECWLWTGCKTGAGYGQLTHRGQSGLRAHRVTYEALVGPIPAGLVLDHLCRNRACVNPYHLEPVPQRVNVLRGESSAARNARKTHCPRGHEYDNSNTRIYAGRRYCRACAKARAKSA